MNPQPFWEKSYKDGRAATFGKPSAEIVALCDGNLPFSSALDAGCGDGRNAVHMAQKGIHTDAFDLSRAGIKKLEHAARSTKLPVRAWVQDLSAFTARRRYDLVVCHGVLHLLHRQDWETALYQLGLATAPGGFMVIAVFTDKVPSPDDLAPFTKGLFKEGELFDRFNNWIVHQADSYILNDEHPGNIRHTHAVNKIVVQKSEPAAHEFA